MMNLRHPLSLAILFALGSSAFADAPKSSVTPQEQLEAIRAESKAATAAYYKEANALPDTLEGSKKSNELFKAYDKGQAAGFLAAVELAQANSDSDLGLEALEWMLTTPRSYYLPAGKIAMELATEKYAAHPKIGKLIATLGWVPPYEGVDSRTAALALLNTVAKKNPDRTAQGQAEISLAYQSFGHFSIAEYKKAPDLEKLAGDAEKAYEKVLDEYGDCYLLRGDEKKTLGALAKQFLFSLRHLRVGKVAPDIEAVDLDGAKFKLSDSNDKIRLVVFWASWCGPCMAMVPQEREIVARMKDRPFALIGVNGDEDRAKGNEVAAKNKMGWRSFWNGSKTATSTLAQDWNVTGWPTVYVLDDRGVIRFKDLHRDELDKAVDELVDELEKKAKK